MIFIRGVIKLEVQMGFLQITLSYTKEEVSVAYSIDEDRFIDICIEEIDERNEVGEGMAQAVAITLNWVYYKSLADSKQRG